MHRKQHIPHNLHMFCRPRGSPMYRFSMCINPVIVCRGIYTWEKPPVSLIMVTQNSQLEGSEEYIPYWSVDVQSWDIEWNQQDGELASEVADNTMAYNNIMSSEFCGQCPETIALLAFIQEFLLGDQVSAYGQNNSSANCNMPELCNNFGALLNDLLPGSDGDIQFSSYAGISARNLHLDFERSSTSCSVLLDMDNTTLYDFDDIESVLLPSSCHSG